MSKNAKLASAEPPLVPGSFATDPLVLGRQRSVTSRVSVSLV